VLAIRQMVREEEDRTPSTVWVDQLLDEWPRREVTTSTSSPSPSNSQELFGRNASSPLLRPYDHWPGTYFMRVST
jgi:hypothetical protein